MLNSLYITLGNRQEKYISTYGVCKYFVKVWAKVRCLRRFLFCCLNCGLSPNQRYESWSMPYVHAALGIPRISQISRIIKLGTPKLLFKVCLNLLKRNLSCQPPIRVLRVICDSDNTHAKNFTHPTYVSILT